MQTKTKQPANLKSKANKLRGFFYTNAARWS